MYGWRKWITKFVMTSRLHGFGWRALFAHALKPLRESGSWGSSSLCHHLRLCAVDALSQAAWICVIGGFSSAIATLCIALYGNLSRLQARRSPCALKQKALPIERSRGLRTRRGVMCRPLPIVAGTHPALFAGLRQTHTRKVVG
jgi:hypothetical protein